MSGWPTDRTPDAVPRTRRSDLRDEAAVVGALVAIWLLLWGELSVANVVSGVVVSVALLLVFPVDHDVIAVRHRLRPVAVARLVAFFLADLVRSTAATALDVLRGGRGIATGIVACPLRVQNDGLVTFLANMIALSPGTMPVDVRREPHVIYVHSLHARDPDAVRRFVSRLEHLAVMALGGPQAVGAVAGPAAGRPAPPRPDRSPGEGSR